MKKVYLDSDVIIDLILERKPFNEHTKRIFQSSKNNILSLYTSADCITNIFYVLRKFSGAQKAKNAISRILSHVKILAVDEVIIFKALGSEINDFEDAVQYLTAQINNMEYFVTRNIRDFVIDEVPVITSLELLKLI